MDAALYRSLREQVLERHTNAIREADAERDADLAALERVRRLAGDEPRVLAAARNTSSTETVGTSLAAPQIAKDRPGIGSLVESIVTTSLSNQASFDLRDVQRLLQEREPDFPLARSNAVTQVLRRLAEQGKIEQLEVGQGRRPTTYTSRKTDCQDNPLKDVTLCSLE